MTSFFLNDPYVHHSTLWKSWTRPQCEHALRNGLERRGPRLRPEQTGLKLHEVTDKTLHMEGLAVPPFSAA